VTVHSGRHFLQIPGPTNVPDRVLRAIAAPVIDHRGPEFAGLFRDIMPGLRRVFGTEDPVVIFPSSGTGAWEAALVNTLSPGDEVLIAETGHFAALWARLAGRLGLRPQVLPGDWRHGADPDEIGRRLAGDTGSAIKAVLVVHNETSTGVTSRVPEIRAEMDRTGHPALLIVDTISSLGSMPYRHRDWGVDVTVGGSQKGLMLPPGLGFNAISGRARDAAATAGLPRAYWDWEPVLAANEDGFYPYTPATSLLYGLREALVMLDEEGLAAVWDRHARHAEATRRAIRGWGLEVQCADPREYSASVTAVVLPPGHDADQVRQVILDRFDMSLGTGLGRLAGRVFRIGHLGHFNDLTLAGALCGVEMGLQLAKMPIQPTGVAAALDYLRTC
jgi:alanine-glyoxylate transaminase / serine-glyoxylate transaminase / serine-pyruvate transaminase